MVCVGLSLLLTWHTRRSHKFSMRDNVWWLTGLLHVVDVGLQILLKLQIHAMCEMPPSCWNSVIPGWFVMKGHTSWSKSSSLYLTVLRLLWTITRSVLCVHVISPPNHHWTSSSILVILLYAHTLTFSHFFNATHAFFHRAPGVCSFFNVTTLYSTSSDQFFDQFFWTGLILAGLS